jgi:hypothetical protein
MLIITRLDTIPLLGARVDKFVGDVTPFKPQKEPKANVTLSQIRVHPPLQGDLKMYAQETFVRHEHVKNIFDKDAWGDDSAFQELFKVYSKYGSRRDFESKLAKKEVLVYNFSKS